MNNSGKEVAEIEAQRLPCRCRQSRQERLERLIEDMKQAQGITEQLKAENALEWTKEE